MAWVQDYVTHLLISMKGAGCWYCVLYICIVDKQCSVSVDATSTHLSIQTLQQTGTIQVCLIPFKKF